MDLIEVIINKDGSFTIKGLDMNGSQEVHDLEKLLAKELGLPIKDTMLRQPTKSDVTIKVSK